MCASSYLRFLSQIFTSSLSSSGLQILRPHLVFTRSDLHRRVTLSLSYHLQDFIMQLLSQLDNLIYLRLQNFISPRSRANRRLVTLFVGHLDSQLKYTDLFAPSCGFIGDFTDTRKNDETYIMPKPMKDYNFPVRNFDGTFYI